MILSSLDAALERDQILSKTANSFALNAIMNSTILKNKILIK